MSQHSTPIEATMPSQGSNRPLLSALSNWWSPVVSQQAADPEVGYESALPWTLEAAGDADHAPY